MFQSVKDWLWSHPLLYPFILFVLACLVEIYARDIRSFLHNWPRTKKTVRGVAKDDLTKRLVLLKSLHNDSYQLILYLAHKGFELIIEWIVVAVTLSVILLVLHHTIEDILSSLIGVCLGALTGMFYDIRKVLNQLSDYDRAVTKLQNKLDDLKAKEVVAG